MYKRAWLHTISFWLRQPSLKDELIDVVRDVLQEQRPSLVVTEEIMHTFISWVRSSRDEYGFLYIISSATGRRR